MASNVYGRTPKAVIAPHAGDQFSGPIAASAYAFLASGRDTIKRVVLLGPSHFVTLPRTGDKRSKNLSITTRSHSSGRSDARSNSRSVASDYLGCRSRKRACLEVYLPFLQIALGEFKLLPLAVGDAMTDNVGAMLNELWDGEETCIVVRLDLSHYHDYQITQQIGALPSL